MKTKILLLVVLAVAQSVWSADPVSPFRQLTGIFANFETTRNGEARLDIHGETIKRISSLFGETAKNISVEITEGGVGFSYVTFSYQVPPEGEGSFDTYIFTRDTDEVVNASNYSPLDGYDVDFEYYVRYNTSNVSRADLFSVIFDREACTCSGDSQWYYANGSREIKGGYPNNYFDLVLNLPEGVAGNSLYGCAYPVGEASSRKIRSLPRLVEDSDQIGLLQRYETIDYTTTPKSIWGWYQMQDILSYEGGVEWFNGTGVWTITGGGPGTDYLGFNYTQDAYTWGILNYDFMIKMPWVPDIPGTY